MFKIDHIFNSQTKTITFAAILLAVSTLLSRILGLVRDRLLAGRFGAGPELDVYFAAFQLPDFIYGVLILGGVSVVFLPMFSEFFEKDQKKAWKFANQLLNCFLVLIVLLCFVLFLFAPWLIELIVPGFSAPQKTLTVSLARLIFVSNFFFAMAGVFSGILQYFNRFLAYSLAPILYNLSIIFGIIFLVPAFGIYGVVYGVILGSILFAASQILPARKCGYFYQFRLGFGSPELIRAFKVMLPRNVARLSYQLNLIVITAIASTLAVGSIAIFNLAQNLQYLPIGVIGLSFGIASFPVLSRHWAKGDKAKFLEDFSSSFRQILFLIIPASILMFLLRREIVQLILRTGQFGISEVELTAAALGLFSFGILASSSSPLLIRAFFSVHNTKIPTITSIISISLNIISALLFVRVFGFPNIFQKFLIDFLNLDGANNIALLGLPLAFSLSATVQFLLLFFLLHRKVGGLGLGAIWQSLKKIIVASILMAVAVYFLLQISINFINPETFWGVLLRAGLAASFGVFVYALTTLFLKSPELKTIWHSVRK